MTEVGSDASAFGGDLSAGALLSLIASGRARSRSDLVAALGWSRATMTQRLSFLLAEGFVAEAAQTVPSGGRPTRVLRINERFGIVLVADVGERSIRLAATDLTPTVLVETRLAMDVGDGPVAVLGAVADGFATLIERLGRRAHEIVGIGLGLPAPVDFAAGRVVGPSIMRGWDDFDIRTWMSDRFDAPVFIENDVNLMTLAEARRHWRDVPQLFFVKVGTGIGSGIIADGHIYRGAQGAAGDIGHIQINGAQGPLCRCGKCGCVEASASGWAMARDLRALGYDAGGARSVLALVQDRHPQAVGLIRGAGRIIGEVVASVVSLLNPTVIVVGGTLSEAGDHLISGIRELVYQRSLPLATRELVISASRSGEEAVIVGAATLVLETQMSPGAVEQVIARRLRAPVPKRFGTDAIAETGLA